MGSNDMSLFTGRRDFLCKKINHKIVSPIAFFFVLFWFSQAHAVSSPNDPTVQASKNLATQNLIKITSLPVFPWMSLSQTSCQQVINSISRFNGIGIISSGGNSTITSGEFFNITNVPFRQDAFLFGEPGLRAVSIHCSPPSKGRSVSYVTWIVERGPRDELISALIERLTQRYRGYAIAMPLSDSRGETEDRYVIFDFGRFVAEVSVPEQQDKAYITFAVRSIYEQTRKNQGQWDLIAPYLIPLQSN